MVLVGSGERVLQIICYYLGFLRTAASNIANCGATGVAERCGDKRGVVRTECITIATDVIVVCT